MALIKITTMKKSVSLLLIGLLIFSTNQISAQEDVSKRKSPPAEVSGKVGPSEITINYSQPFVKGRTVWGDLVPYDKVWRTGANEATTINFSKDIIVGGNLIEAGKYALFTIPSKGEWVVIFNSVHEQWGAYKYDEAKDVLRIKVTPTTASEMTEKMTIEIVDGDRSGMINIKWEKLVIPVKLRAKMF